MNVAQPKIPTSYLVLAWCLVVGVYALRPIEAFDTFWQLQSGKYIWQTGQFLYRDTFSMASDVFRLEHCWLHDLVLYVLYSAGGYPLLGLLKPLVVAICAGLLLVWNQRLEIPVALSAAVIMLCLMASADSWLVRPQLWTFLFSILYLVLLYRGRDKGWRSWIWLVPLMLLWANLHAACIFGFALFGAYWTGDLYRAVRRRIPWRSLAELSVIGGLIFAVSFLNPYGWRIPLEQFLGQFNQTKVATGTASPGLLGNMEWLPPTFDQVPLFYLVMALWALTLCGRIFRRQIEVAELCFFLGFCYMGFSQIRHTTLVAMLAGFFLPAGIATLLPKNWREGLRSVLATAAVGLLLLGSVAWVGVQGRLGLGLAPHEFPVAGSDFVRQHRPPGNLYNAYDWGGYLMWRLYPDYLVFVDGRTTSNRYFVASSQIENGWDGWLETLDKEGVNLIVTRTCFYDSGGPQNLIGGLARSRDWALVFQDDTSVVYVRRLPANAELIRQYGMPNHLAYRTMLAEATRLQQTGYPRPRTWLALGRAHFALGNRTQALDAYQEFLQASPGDREAQRMIRVLSERRGG